MPLLDPPHKTSRGSFQLLVIFDRITIGLWFKDTFWTFCFIILLIHHLSKIWMILFGQRPIDENGAVIFEKCPLVADTSRNWKGEKTADIWIFHFSSSTIVRLNEFRIEIFVATFDVVPNADNTCLLFLIWLQITSAVLVKKQKQVATQSTGHIKVLEKAIRSKASTQRAMLSKARQNAIHSKALATAQSALNSKSLEKMIAIQIVIYLVIKKTDKQTYLTIYLSVSGLITWLDFWLLKTLTFTKFT